jgi:hypothetical protein
MLGTAMRCVSRYSESWWRNLGLTTLTRDFEARLPVRLRSAAWRADFVWLYCENFDFTSLSMPWISCRSYLGGGIWGWKEVSTFCNESIRSAMGLSARYLTLFHWNVRRYWSTGSTMYVRRQNTSKEVSTSSRTIVDGLLLLDLCFISIQYRPQAVANLAHHALTRRAQLCQLIRLLY